MSKGPVMKEYGILQKLKDIQYPWNRMWEWRELSYRAAEVGRDQVIRGLLGQGKGLSKGIGKPFKGFKMRCKLIQSAL